jgi:Fic family protein
VSDLISRSGHFVKQREGYSAFIPAPLPPEPPLDQDQEIGRLLSDADRALGRLDGVCSVLPSPDFFVAMYVRYEAVLSSQIEGTQSTLEDVIDYESGEQDTPKDVEEVVNYIKAMNHGLAQIRSGDLPLSLRLIREIHAKLMAGTRGSERNPGEFRRSQNWIGPGGCALKDATYVPPPVHEMTQALGDLEKFLHAPGDLPALIHCAYAHAQFETIHPFLDGNGRVGRLLITFLLCHRDILEFPLLYLSHYFKLHRMEYYDRLTAIRRNGDWEGWIKFFLRGVATVSRDAVTTARKIITLRETTRKQVADTLGSMTGSHPLLDYLFEQPAVTANQVKDKLGISFAQANKILSRYEELGLVKETTGQKRNRRFRFDPYLNLFRSPEDTPPESLPDTTQA